MSCSSELHIRGSTRKKAKLLTYSSLAHYVWTCEGRKERNENRNINVCRDKMKSKLSLPEKAIICKIIH